MCLAFPSPCRDAITFASPKLMLATSSCDGLPETYNFYAVNEDGIADPVSGIGPVPSKHCETNYALEQKSVGEVTAYKMGATDPPYAISALQLPKWFPRVHPLAKTYVPYFAELE